MKSTRRLRPFAVTWVSAVLVSTTPAQQVAKLLAADGADNDRFGASVAAWGQTLLAGAPGDDGGRGAVYVFQWDSTTGWAPTARLTAGVREANAAFGHSVAIWGDVAVVGAPLEDSRGTDAGAVYVFRNIAGVWIQTARITAPDAAPDDRFGSSVDLRSGVLVVGAPRDDDSGMDSGSVHVFRFDGANWIHETKLRASDAQSGDQFGFDVAVVTDRIVAGAPYADANGPNSGAAYVFVADGAGSWAQQQKLQPPNQSPSALFAWSVSTEQSLLVVGTPRGYNANSQPTGAAFVFQLQGDTWVHQQKLAPLDLGQWDRFGSSVAIDGSRIAIGAWSQDPGATDAGAVYLYALSGGSWVRERKLVASDADVGDHFGTAVAVAGDWVVCGAPDDDDNGTDSGSAYVFLACGPADLDGDGDVDLGDLTRLLADFGCFGECVGDIDADGDTDLSDLAVLLADFGTSCPQ